MIKIGDLPAGRPAFAFRGQSPRLCDQRRTEAGVEIPRRAECQLSVVLLIDVSALVAGIVVAEDFLQKPVRHHRIEIRNLRVMLALAVISVLGAVCVLKVLPERLDI